jgi:hypothetical protein
VQAEDKAGRVPIHDIEQLASIEARLGEKLADEDNETRAVSADKSTGKGTPVTDTAPKETPLGLIELALKRLDGLDTVVSVRSDEEKAALAPNGERSALRGNAFKCKAALYARQVVSITADAKGKADAAELMRKALISAVDAYTHAEGSPNSGRFSPYHALNRLALDALTPWSTPEQKDAAIALAAQCRKAAAQAYARNPNAWDAVMQPEALLVERMLDGTFGRTGESGQLAFDDVARAYTEAMSNLTLKPSEIDSVVTQLDLLSLFHEALAVTDRDAARRRVVVRLRDLVQFLRPGRRRPAGPPISAPDDGMPSRESEAIVPPETPVEAKTLPKEPVTTPKSSQRTRATTPRKQRRKSE